MTTLSNTDTLWFDVAVVLAIFAIGGVLFGRFEEHRPRWRRLLKIPLVLGVVLGLSSTLGHFWGFMPIALLLCVAAYIHLRWLPRHGINGGTAEPRDQYLELLQKKRRWRTPDKPR